MSRNTRKINCFRRKRAMHEEKEYSEIKSREAGSLRRYVAFLKIFLFLENQRKQEIKLAVIFHV